MTLLAELFDRLDSTPLAVAQAPAVALVGVVEVGASVLASGARQRPAAEAASEPQHIVRTAATASPAWLAVRDQFHNHIFGDCPGCHPPTGRYCPTGAELRAIYDTTPMELTP